MVLFLVDWTIRNWWFLHETLSLSLRPIRNGTNCVRPRKEWERDIQFCGRQQHQCTNSNEIVICCLRVDGEVVKHETRNWITNAPQKNDSMTNVQSSAREEWTAKQSTDTQTHHKTNKRHSFYLSSVCRSCVSAWVLRHTHQHHTTYFDCLQCSRMRLILNFVFYGRLKLEFTSRAAFVSRRSTNKWDVPEHTHRQTQFICWWSDLWQWEMIMYCVLCRCVPNGSNSIQHSIWLEVKPA